MDIITRWKLGEKLNEEEVVVILSELFEGASKSFVFDTETKIDQRLYRIYEKFPDSKNTNWILKFSNTETERPFVSFVKYDLLKSVHKIFLNDDVLFIYE